MAVVRNFQISSTISKYPSERRFADDLTVGELKGKLELITGSSSNSMKLEFYDEENQLKATATSDDAILSSHPGFDHVFRIHVIDLDPAKKVGMYEDLSKVEKYELDEEEYHKKTDSVRHFMMKNKLGKYSEDALLEKEKEAAMLEKEKLAAKTMEVGSRCEVRVKGQPEKRGTIRYAGETDFQPGVWIGVEYDEPTGKNDGSVKGRRYFTCSPKYGGFVKLPQVTVGDFPELDIDEM